MDAQRDSVRESVSSEGREPRDGARRARPWWISPEWLGFLLLIAALLPYKLWRMSLTSNVWMDEVYTFMLSTKSIPYLVDLTTVDSHPPLSALWVKGWYALGSALFETVGIFWCRLMNLIPWLAMAAGAWFGGRRFLGPTAGAVAAWTVMASAQTFDVTQWVRGYAVLCPALFLCFLILLAFALDAPEARPMPRRRAYTFWFLYLILGSVALWTHLLAAFALAVYGLIWIGMVAKRRALFQPLGIGGAAAQILIILSFAPWLCRIPTQLRFFKAFAGARMPPPLVEEWVNVFRFWYPFGQLRETPPPSFHPMILLGTLAMAAPIGAAAIGWAWRRNQSASADATSRARDTAAARDAALLRAGLLGCGAAFGFVTLTWILHRANISMTFMGRRYASLVAAPWAFGLAALAGYGVRRLGFRDAAAILLLLPWFVAAIVGQVHTIRLEQSRGLKNWLGKFSATFLDPAQPVYAMPEEAIPLFRREMAGMTVLPFRHMSKIALPREKVVVLDLCPWPTLRTPEQRVAQSAFDDRLFSDGTLTFHSNDPFAHFRFHWMPDFKPRGGRVVLDRRFRPVPVPVPADARATARPDGLFEFDGWYDLEIDSEFRPFRWGRGGATRIVFDKPLTRGSHTLEIRGYRQPYPREQETMTFRFLGEPEEETVSLSVEPGSMALSIPFRLERDHPEPTLEIVHPGWVPKEQGVSGDSRSLSWLFSVAWVEDEP